MGNQLVTIPVPGANTPIMAVQKDGTEWAAARHICDALGIDWKSQHRKLGSKSWARVVMMTTHDTSGRKQEISMVDRRTLTMWLATIDTNRVSEAARPTLEAYQLEAANALDSYFHKGGAINPRAEEHQLNALMRQSQMQMELCQAAKGLIHPDHLEAKARIVLARGLGEAPELDPETRPLYTAADKAVAELAKTRRPFTADDVRAACGVEPDSPNAWGGLFRYWKCRGLIHHVGFTRSRGKARNASVVGVWQGNDIA